MRRLRTLLVFLPVALRVEALGWSDVAVFATSALAVVPLAGLLGDATEVLAEKTGPRVGGLLNASLGNAAELIITLVAIQAGALELVKASIIGSIVGNVLLVLGLSILLGGLRHGVQRFDRTDAGLDATLLILAVIAVCVPALFSGAIEPDRLRAEEFNVGNAVVILVLYGLSIVYTLRSRAPERVPGPTVRLTQTGPRWTTRRSLAVLAGSVAGIAVMSELLVGSVEPMTEAFGLSAFFVGIIIIPLIGNVAEHMVAVQVALKDKMDLSLSIAMGSSLQMALFVAPVLVLVSIPMGHPFLLEFNTLEMVAMIAASMIAAFISIDGRSNWLEGAMLLGVYLMLALGFFFAPITF